MAATNHRCNTHANPQKSVRERVMLASCSLLSATAHADNIEINESGWQTDISLVSYSEANDRIDVDKFLTNINGALDDNNRLNIDIVIDTMTGSTPTGALPIVTNPNAPVTITNASGSPITIPAGAAQRLEITEPFEDDRYGLNLQWQHDFNSTLRLQSGISISDENDYHSDSVSFIVEKDTAQKVATYSVGLAFTDDSITRADVDAVPIGLSSTQQQLYSTSESKSYTELLLGYSHIMNERTLVQINLTFVDSDGYHTDPYKVISVSDGTSDVDLLFERRPDSRQSNILYTQFIQQSKYGHDGRIAYRYFSDDWGIESYTLEASYRFNFNNQYYLEPQIRIYDQGAADFYAPSILQGQALPASLSADPRLANMDSLSAGFKYGIPLENNKKLRFRYEKFDQNFSNAVINENEATIFQVSYLLKY